MSEENLYTFENPEYRQDLLAHLLPRHGPGCEAPVAEVQLAIGPSIAEGWYYDFDSPFSFTQEHLDQIEAEMKKICRSGCT